MTGYEKIIPGALSPDGKKVLCSTGKKIILYFIDDNKIETIKENKYISVGSIFIWRPDGKSFLYWESQWSLLEGKSLFLFTLNDRTETDLSSGINAFGGVVGDFEKWK